tara:strand:- start:44273 stop:45946 length:1674 start_codon:yes stop_codon:yes gene_type:complete
MCIPGLLYLVHFVAIGILWMAVAVALTITTSLASLLWLRISRDPVASGVIGVAAFTCLLTLSAYSTGGFYGPNFAWLYVIPVFAALLANMRAGAIFTGLVLLITVGFWIAERNGLPLVNLIPEDEQAVRSLADRGGAILVIGVALIIFASRERLGNRKLSDAYDSLKVEMLQREQFHDRMIHTERLASMGKLSAAVAHEINNPMTYVIGNLQALQEPSEFGDDDQDELIRDALDGALRVSALVKDMQVYSRTPGKIRLDDVDVSAALDTAAKMVGNRLRYCAQFRLDCEPGLRARASEAQLVQIIVNLLTNAIDAIEGAVEENELALVARTHERGVSIEVRDTGEGIPGEVQKKLFEPFFTTKDIGQGTGMGLAISRSLIEGMDGSIEFTSQPGEGTTFLLVLPAADASGPEVSLVHEAPSRDPAEPALKILVIDDDRAVLRTIRRMLAKQDVCTEDDAKRALALCKAEDFDVILCDIMMPSMSGDQFYRELIASQPTLADRVTFMTGGVLTRDTEKFLVETDRPVLQKPLDVEELRAIASAQTSLLPDSVSCDLVK